MKLCVRVYSRIKKVERCQCITKVLRWLFAEEHLASYSMDRKCLHEYIQHLTNVDTNALVCFVCARRCFHVSGGKNNEFALRSLLTCEVDGKIFESSMCFLGMKQELATKMFGVTKYCNTYGRMSEGVHLAEYHDKLDD